MERYPSFCIITVTSGKSKRFKGKNLYNISGKPLIKHTTDFINELMEKSFCLHNYFVITDCKDIAEFCFKNNIHFKVIPKEYNKGKRDHAEGMRVMRWIHGELKYDYYIMFPVTTPKRDLTFIQKITNDCMEKRHNSATTIYKKDRNNYVNNGSFWFFSKEQLREDDLIDDNTVLYIDKDNIDVDTKKDLKRLKKT